MLERVGTNDSAGSHSLWLVRADGTELRELAPGVPVDGKADPTWSPDGERIAFETVGPLRRVYEAYAAGGAPGLIWHECSGLVAEPNPCVEGSPTYSPDGQELATVASFDGLETNVIYIRHRYFPNDVCEAASGICYHLGSELLPATVRTTTGSIENLSWSPDGTQIAYDLVSRVVDGNALATSELWVVTVDGGQAVEIPLPTDLVAGNPKWSPDGAVILFSGEPRDEMEAGASVASDLYTVRPDGSKLHRLTDDNASGSASWTSDARILFYRQPWMWLMDSDGSNGAPLLWDAPAIWTQPAP